ncbi:cyclic nucleotide-binding protein [Paramagnetospirillum kuznetsovii]|uniref:Cyclic nucleotide-binding protein n=1 Tax=Paramagnetospirillum kuznetsovii TaxID=2053833 RepID=A0A364NVR2_9PROT|nr:bacteriohemerythrin [Paramagnetospirillum kuznetsovii]RAU21179.1 cyclic nucleotide-binding protein [Paramagnetospirillum kuznetsovii]
MPLLRKIEVTTGVWWIEAPQAGLYVLCGCPADSVKHLMKRGLIVSAESNGIPFETGPNAILLSDAMVQNGNFSNLAEFPVLQMLYRQGMIVPNHPGNTGVNPLLIGSNDQVQAQMQYIYRGNYGLVTEEEIVEAGETPERARDLMRMKLKFAFGKIRHPGELIDTLAVDTDPVEIRNGVFVRRMLFNVFEFSYQGETAVVDLNLPSYETYEAPYPLGFYQLKREYFAVIHCGEGDGWDINRPSMASIVMFQGKVYLVDAGPNILYSLNSLGIGVNEIEGIFHTHSHDDHFAGLTTLIRSDHKLKYYATPLVKASVAKKVAALLAIDEEAFDEYFDVCPLVEGEWNHIEGLEVMPVFSPHPVETTNMRFRAMWEGGYRSYNHLADICRLSVLQSFITEDAAAPGISQALYDQVAADYLAPADVKKIDVGGGMIHGDAYDFRNDSSGKIILAHTSQRNTRAQKAIGSSASFGTIDVLIPSNHDFIWPYAYEALDAYFPGIPRHQMRVLLNNPVVTFNPGTILVKERLVNDQIYLLLSGSVEMIPIEVDMRSVLSAGALIGELSGLFGAAASETYRAASFVQALAIPASLYSEFVRRNEVFPDVSRLVEHREFLLRTTLFGEVVSSKSLNRIAQSITSRAVKEGVYIDLGHDVVGMIKAGSAGRFLGDHMFETLKGGDFFGEDYAIFNTPSLLRVKALEPCEVFLVPAHTLRDIPSVRWKLFEASTKRTRSMVEAGEHARVLIKWHDEYSVGVQRIDAHHRRLFEIANSVLDLMERAAPNGEVAETMGLLREYARFHFGEEEGLLARYKYPDLVGHKARHARLMVQLTEMQATVAEGGAYKEVEVLTFLQEWIVGHTLSDDHRAAVYLNSKGVY